MASTVHHTLSPMLPATEDVTQTLTRSHIGPYRLLSVLGEGGTARVYEAEHTIIGKRVAIKTLLPALADRFEAQARFAQEARIACSVRAPGVVEVFDFAHDDDERPYCVMERLEGMSLAEHLRRAPLPLSHSLELAIQLADALSAVHAAGYLHRDIKAENVVISNTSQEGLRATIVDFGIAKRLSASGEDGAVVGTPRTMSPEQIARDPIDERTDIWGLGVLLYEMLTGRLPFPSGETIREDFIAILLETPSPLDYSVPADVRSIVHACLCKDPEGRPASAAALGELLRRARSAHLDRCERLTRSLHSSLQAAAACVELDASIDDDDDERTLVDDATQLRQFAAA